MTIPQALVKLSMSKFRGRFKLDNDMVAIVTAKGFEAMRVFAEQRIAKTLAPAAPPNDGRQTPLKGHPVFLAQHATATCCRTCLNNWWRVRKGIALTAEQQKKITNLIMAWIEMQVNGGIESVKKKMSDHGHWGVGSASLPLPPPTPLPPINRWGKGGDVHNSGSVEG